MYRREKRAGRPFDLLILDLTIPGGQGGKETMKRLLAEDPKVRALVSSGYSNDPVMSRFHEHGFQGVVKKPYRMDDLGSALEAVLGKAGAANPPAASVPAQRRD